MAITTMTSREFNRDTGKAKAAARRGPVYITDRGRPAHVLLSFADYQRLASGEATIVDLLGAPAGVEVAELDIPHLRDRPHPADLA